MGVAVILEAFFVRSYLPTDSSSVNWVADAVPVEGGWIVVGNYSPSVQMGLVMKIDTAGEVVWQKGFYHPNTLAMSLEAACVQDTLLWVAGMAYFGGLPPDSVCPIVIKMTTNGTALAFWELHYPYRVRYIPLAITARNDTVVVVGKEIYGARLGIFQLSLNAQSREVLWANWYYSGGGGNYWAQDALFDGFGTAYLFGSTDENGDTALALWTIDFTGSSYLGYSYYGGQGDKLRGLGLWRDPARDIIYGVGLLESDPPLSLVIGIDNSYSLAFQDTIKANPAVLLQDITGVGDTLVAVGSMGDYPLALGLNPADGSVLWAKYGTFSVGDTISFNVVLAAPDSGWVSLGHRATPNTRSLVGVKSLSEYQDCLVSALVVQGPYQMGRVSLDVRIYSESPQVRNLGLGAVSDQWLVEDLCEYHDLRVDAPSSGRWAWFDGEVLVLNLPAGTEASLRVYEPSGRLIWKGSLKAGERRVRVPGRGLRIAVIEEKSVKQVVKVF